MDEGVVATAFVRAIKQDADLEQVIGEHCVAGGWALRIAPFGYDRGRFEALSGQQQGVGQESVQLSEVRRAALREIEVRFGSGPDRNGRMAHEFGIGSLLATEDQHGHTGGEDGVEAVLPRAGRAEDSHHDEVGAVDHRRKIARDIQPRRVGEHILRSRGAGRQEVGVGRGQQRDTRHGSPFRGSRPTKWHPQDQCLATEMSWRTFPYSGGTAPDLHRVPDCPDDRLIVRLLDPGTCLACESMSLDRFAADEMPSHDFAGNLAIDASVPNVIGLHAHQGRVVARELAARMRDEHVVVAQALGHEREDE